MRDPIPRNRLRSLRKEQGLTLQQVANAIGVAFSTVYELETSGREVTLATAFRLSEFYGLPLDEIWQPLYDQICGEVVPAPNPRA